MADAPEKKNAFEMMKSRKKYHKQPAHRPPTDGQGHSCKWNPWEARFEADEQYQKEGWYRSDDFRTWIDPNAAAPPPPNPVGRPPADAAADADAPAPAAEEPPAKKAKKRIVFLEHWKGTLGGLLSSLRLGPGGPEGSEGPLG